MEKKSIAVLGLGKYGASLAAGLYDLGMDVLVADQDEERVQDFAERSTVAVTCDLSDEGAVRALGLQNMDTVVVAMAANFEATVLCVVLAKELGVPFVVAKASSPRMGSVLQRVGADRVIDPEAESGLRSARAIASPAILDIFADDENLCILEMTPKDGWLGRNLSELNLRRHFGLNVIAVREGERKWVFPDPAQPLGREMKMLVALEKRSLPKIQ